MHRCPPPAIPLLKNNIAAGSYAVLEIALKNKQQHYLPLSIYMIKGPELVGKNIRHAMLKPSASEKEYFIMKVPEDIKEGYKVEYTIGIQTAFNNYAETKLHASRSYGPGFLLDGAEKIIEMLAEDKREYSYDVSLECLPEKAEFYKEEEIKAECIIANKGNVLLENLKLCTGDECTMFSLPIGTVKNKTFTLSNEKKDHIFQLENSLVSKSAYLGLNILEKPDLRILDIEPKEINYTQNIIYIMLETNSLCKNAVIKINGAAFEIDGIELKQTLPVSFPGKYALGEKIKIKAECYDLRGRVYEDKKEFAIKIKGIPWYGKVIQPVIKLFAKIFG